jgi:uncharacterized protein YjbJ (UPF0337 family)
VAGNGDGEGESLEAAVKGIAQGLTGKLKEAAGEMLEDESLEQEGIEQQHEAELRRAAATESDGDREADRP